MRLCSWEDVEQLPISKRSKKIGGDGPGDATHTIAGSRAAARRIATSGLALGVLACSLSACSTAPAQNIMGSFFPAWMLCAFLGIIAAVVLRLCLGAVGLAAFVPLPAVTFVIVAAAVTLLVWLIRFGH
jgi:hypothetical protein